jgi:glycosyltransferase involved in cell wall biosynthesis
VILYYGTFEPYQGLDLLVDSIKFVVAYSSDVEFMLVGGAPEQIEKLQKKGVDQGVSGYILFTGTVPPHKIPAYTEMADILVSPRIGGSNTPLKIYAYLRSGKPIVATNHPSHTQVLTPELAMLTAIHPQAIADGIIALLRNPGLRGELASNARRFAEEHFRWETVREKIRTMYDQLAGAPSGRP